MANSPIKVANLAIATSLANTDRIVVLVNPASTANVKTITLSNFANSVVSYIPVANTTANGVVRVGNNLSINATGHLSVIVNNRTPASANDDGTTGEICWDNTYVYVCIANNTWKRSTLNTW